MKSYCCPCLDVWSIERARITRGDWVTIAPGVHMHVTCGRALEQIRTTPPAVVLEREEDAERWAA